MPESFKGYTELVCRQLRWKKARPVIEQEIGTHLCDQRDALMKSGMDEDSATHESIRQMGDAVEIGTELDRVHRPKPAWELFALTILLALIGVFIRAFLAYDSNAPWQPIYNVAAVLLGTGCMLGAYFLDFTIIGKCPLLVYSGALLASVLFVILRHPIVNGKYYYAQYVLLLFPLAFAALLYRLRGRKHVGFFLALAGVVLLSFCCILVPSVGGLAITVLSALALVIIAAAGDWFSIGRARTFVFIGAAALIAAILLLLAITVGGGLAARISAAFNPWSDPMGMGWEGVFVRELVGGARFIGCGTTGEYSAGVSTYGDIMNTDFLLTWLIHNVGWIAFIAVMSVFAAFLFCGFRLCFKQKNMLGRLVSLAVMLTLTLQTVFYVAMNLGFDLIYSISLPLISYGNTATVINMSLIGVMLSTIRTGSLVKDGTPGQRTASRRLFWKNGELTISFKRHIAS